jgi:hypothetical protein
LDFEQRICPLGMIDYTFQEFLKQVEEYDWPSEYRILHVLNGTAEMGYLGTFT